MNKGVPLVFLYLLFSLVFVAPVSAISGQLATYSLDEGSDILANDSSGNNYTATLFNSPTWTTSGRYTNALIFDGTNDRARTTASINLPAQYTMLAWVNNSGNSPYETIVTVGSNRDLFINNGQLGFYNGSVELSFGSVPVGSWHHVALVYNGSNFQAYLDGNPLGGPQPSAGGTYSGMAQIGSWIFGSQNVDFFSGTLDEVQIYNRSLSQSEIQTVMSTPIGSSPSPTPTPILPTPTSSPPTPTPTPLPGVDSSLRFFGNGSGDIDRVKIPLDAPARPIDVSGDFTLEWWMKGSSTDNSSNDVLCGQNSGWIYGNIVFDRDVNGPGDLGDYGVSLTGGRVAFGVSNSASGNTICGSTIVTNNTWRHIAVTRSATTGQLSIYVDGILDGQASGPTGDISYRDGRTTSFVNDPYLVIGAEKHDAGPQYPSYNGFMDEVRVSNFIRYTGSFIPSASPFNPDLNTAALYHFNEGAGILAADTSGALGGPSNGTLNIGGSPTGPIWTTDTPFTGSPQPSPTPSPVQLGVWNGPYTWPQAPVHLMLQTNGQVLAWDEENNHHIWNPATNSFTPLSQPASNLFCAGQTTLADGRSLIVGGHLSNFNGIPDTNIFDSVTGSWTRLSDMAYPRWYPTATTLSDGRVLAVSGWVTPSQLAETPEIYNPVSDTWTTLPTASLAVSMYSFMYLLPDGSLFNAGPGLINGAGSLMSRRLNLSTGTWTNVGDSIITGHSSVMYEPGKIMKSGTLGDPDYPLGSVDGRTVVIDTNQPSPAWQEVAAMNFPRSYHNLVQLPDGKVLAVGGGTTTNGRDPVNAVLPTEMWDPATQTWQSMASITRPRLYHSTALLLPDGRVLSSGGYFPPYVEANAEVYSPPYLSAGPRPVISSAPASAGYNTSISVSTPDSAAITKVSLIRLGATTHGFDMSQRYVPLAFTDTGTGLDIQTPASGNIAPPGYYMLFLINNAGVPSIANLLRLDLPNSPTPTPTSVPPTPTPTQAPPTPTPIPPTPTPTPGPGRSLQFDGTNDLAQGLNIPLSTQFTYEAWVKRTSDNNNYQTFLSDANSSYTQAMVTLYVDGSSSDCSGVPDQFAYYQSAGNSTFCSGATASLNVWYHTAVTRDSSGTLRYFVNGTLTATRPASTAPADSSGRLNLGRAGDHPGEYFAGRLDEARVSNIARYTAAFTPSLFYTPDSNTVVLYHLDAGSGQSVVDSSGNARNAVLGTTTSSQNSDPLWSTDIPALL